MSFTYDINTGSRASSRYTPTPQCPGFHLIRLVSDAKRDTSRLVSQYLHIVSPNFNIYQCDETRPHCHRCTTAGVECPGYVQTRKFIDQGATVRRRYAPYQEAHSKSSEPNPSRVRRTANLILIQALISWYRCILSQIQNSYSRKIMS
jgi:hypothetical protein